MPRSQKLWTLVRRSAKVVGVVSLRLSKTLIRPLFSATKTRPSDANSTWVGFVSPLKTTFSWKPGWQRRGARRCRRRPSERRDRADEEQAGAEREPHYESTVRVAPSPHIRVYPQTTKHLSTRGAVPKVA